MKRLELVRTAYQKAGIQPFGASKVFGTILSYFLGNLSRLCSVAIDTFVSLFRMKSAHAKGNDPAWLPWLEMIALLLLFCLLQFGLWLTLTG